MLWVSGNEYLITKLHVIRNIMEARFLYLAASLRLRAAILAKVTKIITFHPCIYIVQCTRVINLVELWGVLIIINVYSSKNIVCACIFLLTINSIYNYFFFSK